MLVSLLDINELSLPPTCRIEFPDPDDLLNFRLYICPDEVNFLLTLCGCSEMVVCSMIILWCASGWDHGRNATVKSHAVAIKLNMRSIRLRVLFLVGLIQKAR